MAVAVAVAVAALMVLTPQQAAVLKGVVEILFLAAQPEAAQPWGQFDTVALQVLEEALFLQPVQARAGMALPAL